MPDRCRTPARSRPTPSSPSAPTTTTCSPAATGMPAAPAWSEIRPAECRGCRPRPVSVIASSVNCSSTSLLRAPMALRTPISRVRSVTDTSMMFITPTPPTISATLDTANMNTKIPPVKLVPSIAQRVLAEHRKVVRLIGRQVPAPPQQCAHLVHGQRHVVMRGRLHADPVLLQLGMHLVQRGDRENRPGCLPDWSRCQMPLCASTSTPITVNSWPSMLISLPTGSSFSNSFSAVS